MQLSLLVPLVLSFVTTYADESASLSSVEYFKRASEQLAEGHDIQALNDFRRALAADPSFKPAQYNLANTYLRLGRIDQALEAAGQCEDPRCTEIIEKCRLFTELSNEQPNEDDCQLFNELLALAPKSTQVLKKRAECYFSNNKVFEALADLTQVAQCDASDSIAAAQSAVGMFILMDQRAKAMQTLRRCVLFNDEATFCKEANKDLRKLQKFVEQPALKIKVSVLLKDTRRLLRKYIIPLQKGHDGALVDNIRKARCYQLALRRKYDEATKVCAQVRDFEPDYPAALLVQAHLDRKQGNYDGALETLLELINGSDDKEISRLAEEMRAEINAERQNSYANQSAPEKDYYEILGVEPSADKREIKKAYRELSKIYHPDKYKGTELDADQVMEKMQNINEAYEILTDDTKRKNYDSERTGAGAGPGSGPRPGGGSFSFPNGFPGFSGFGNQFFFRQG